MSNAAMWALIVGFFMPVIIAVLQQRHWPDGLRAVVTFVACIVAAVGTVLIQHGGWSWHDWVATTLLILVTAIATYHGLFKPTGVAPSVEASTSLPPKRA